MSHALHVEKGMVRPLHAQNVEIHEYVLANLATLSP